MFDKPQVHETQQVRNIEQYHIRPTEELTFQKVRKPALDNINKLSKSYKTRLYEELQQGTAILQNEYQADSYLYAYGRMHQAKLLSAFRSISDIGILPDEQNIQVIDYGCGQGIGSIVFLDYLRSLQLKVNISQIKLIEPSNIALMRATRNINSHFSYIEKRTDITTIHKKLDNIEAHELTTNSEAIKFHIFSNILDIHDFDLNSLCEKIAKSQAGKNYFICVSPNFIRTNAWWRNERLNMVMNYFTNHHAANTISTRETDIASGTNGWKRYERLFHAFL